MVFINFCLRMTPSGPGGAMLLITMLTKEWSKQHSLYWVTHDKNTYSGAIEKIKNLIPKPRSSPYNSSGASFP